jgi:membrane fusion protein (multidrug efflux system)
VLLVNAEGQVEQRQLVLDRALGTEWLVADGLAPGDRVIVEGMQKVRPGTAVKEVPFVAVREPERAPESTEAAATAGYE